MDRLQARHDRRAMLRLLGLSPVALVPALRRHGADAAVGWCRRDPIFSLDRRIGHIYLAVPEDKRQLNNSSTDVVIHHPFKAATNLIFVDPVGFGTGEGISVNFKEAKEGSTDLVKTAAGYQIEIRVFVPMRDSLVPVLVEFAPAPAPGVDVTAWTEGRANQWITLPAWLP